MINKPLNWTRFINQRLIIVDGYFAICVYSIPKEYTLSNAWITHIVDDIVHIHIENQGNYTLLKSDIKII